MKIEIFKNQTIKINGQNVHKIKGGKIEFDIDAEVHVALKCMYDKTILNVSLNNASITVEDGDDAYSESLTLED